MTRIVAGLENLRRPLKAPVVERRWWTREALHLGLAARMIYVSGLLADGAEIHEVQVQGQGSAIGEAIMTGVTLFVATSDSPTVADIGVAEPIIPWGNNPGTSAWVAFGWEVCESWPLLKVMRGSEKRLGVMFVGFAADSGRVRVSVLYSEP